MLKKLFVIPCHSLNHSQFSTVGSDDALDICGRVCINCSYYFLNGMGFVSYRKPKKLLIISILVNVDGLSASICIDKQGWMWTWGGNYDSKTGNEEVSKKGWWADEDTVLFCKNPYLQPIRFRIEWQSFLFNFLVKGTGAVYASNNERCVLSRFVGKSWVYVGWEWG